MTKRKIPLKDITPQTQNLAKNKFSGWGSFFAILLAMAAFLISPIPSYLASLIPQSLISSIMSPIAQKITLDENPLPFTEPRKYQHENPLPALGRNSGVCFTFEHLNQKQIDNANHGKIIAEIIAIGSNKKEYTLDEVTLNQKNIICQGFSRSDSTVAKSVTAIYIRPLKSFSATKVTWASLKEFRQTKNR